MTRVAMHVAAAKPAAIPLADYRETHAKEWDRIARFEAAAGHHILAQACASIAADYRAGRSDPSEMVARTFNPETERYEETTNA